MCEIRRLTESVIWSLLVLLLTRESSCQQYVGRINVNNPGLMNVYSHGSGSAQTLVSILLGSYDTNRNTYDNSYALLHPGLAQGNNYTGYGPSLIYNVLYWPKEVTQVPEKVFNFQAVVHPDGSLISGKTYGSIYITDVNDFQFPATSDIIDPLVSTGHHYSDVEWIHADGGLSWDIITCRVKMQDDIVQEAQLVWLEHPTLDPMTHRWSVHVLKESACDMNVAQGAFRDGLFNNHDVIYATGFYTYRLTFFWTTGLLGQWDNPNNIEARVLAQGRQFYDVQLFDIDYDGDLDVIATSVSQTNGTVEVWEIPADFQAVGEYVHHVIASNFTARTGGADGRSPGVARPFYPTANTQRKPYILVTGADDGRVYYLRPLSEDRANWDYETVTIADYGAQATISGAAAADVDGDGYTDIFVSVHNSNFVDVYTFEP